MHESDPLPLVMPATHSIQNTAHSEPLSHAELGFKQKQLQNISGGHSQPHRLHNQQPKNPNLSQSNTQSNVSLKKMKNQGAKDKQYNGKLSQIIKKKKVLDEQIARLKYEEENQKKVIQKGFNRNMRSYMTEEEKNKIKKALEEKRKFQMLTNMKVKQLENQIRQRQKSEQKQMKERLESMKKQKRKQALSHLQLLKQQQIERKKKIKQANKKYQQAKLKTFLHEKMEEKWKEQIAQNQMNNKKLLQSIKNKKQFSVQQLKKHEQQYRKYIQKDTTQRKKNSSIEITQKKQLQKETLRKYEPSRFLKTVFEEQQKKKQQQQSKTSQLFSNITKKSIFSQTIRQVNKESIMKRQTLSPIKQVSDKVEEGSSQKKSQKTRSLSQMQLFKLGNDYMRQIHSSIDHIDSVSGKERKTEVKKDIKYNDYLKDFKEKRAKMQVNPEVRQIRELKNLMKKQISMDQKWYKAKLLTSRLQQRTDLDTDTLLKSLATKIQLINQFRGD